MAIAVTSVNQNQMIPPSNGQPGPHILSGVVEFNFWGDNDSGVVTRDTLTFNVGPVNFSNTMPPTASCVVSPASFAFNGVANDALWAVDSASVVNFANPDRGSGTAELVVVANLAVRGTNGVMLRANYSVYYAE